MPEKAGIASLSHERILRGMARIPAVVAVLALLVLFVGAGCGERNPNPTPAPVVMIENDSGQPVDVFTFSSRSGLTIKQTTLTDGGTFSSEPAGARCEPDPSYLVVAAGRRVATLDSPGCTGATLVITPQMLSAPEVDESPASS